MQAPRSAHMLIYLAGHIFEYVAVPCAVQGLVPPGPSKSNRLGHFVSASATQYRTQTQYYLSL